jgi:hypothetical protein
MSFARITPLLLGLTLASVACGSDPGASDNTNDTSGTGGETQAGAGGSQSGSGGSSSGTAGSEVTGGSGGSSSGTGTGGATGTGGSAGGSGKGGAGGLGGGANMGGAAGAGGGGMQGPAGARFIGRFDDSNQSAWSGSSIELRFTGTDVSVTMGGANTWYEVVVDGGTPNKMQIGGKATLATGLAAGPHLVQMVRRAEAFDGISKFVSFSVPDSAVLPQQIPGRRIEVIGDSFAVAYGLEGCADRTNAQENAYLSWGMVTGRMVKADVHIVAQSGVGMAFSLGGNPTMPDIYGLTLGQQSMAKWDYSKYVPDAVLIDLGENDQNAKDNNNMSLYNATTFKAKYSAFLTTLRTNYPNAYIYCGSHGDLMTDIQAVVTAKADPKIKFISFNGTRTACDYHPDVAGHQAYANTAAAALKADLGWQ